MLAPLYSARVLIGSLASSAPEPAADIGYCCGVLRCLAEHAAGGGRAQGVSGPLEQPAAQAGVRVGQHRQACSASSPHSAS
eukprot:198599-Prymnesium_polylepis.1